MKEQFVPHELALKLKEKGFDGKCFCFYRENGQVAEGSICFGLIHNSLEGVYDYEKHQNPIRKTIVAAPLWQQVIDWFAEKHNIDISTPPIWSGDGRQYSTIIYLKSTGSIDSDNENTFHLFPEKDTKPEAQLMAIEHALTLI
jgi:hypothetical protein